MTVNFTVSGIEASSEPTTDATTDAATEAPAGDANNAPSTSDKNNADTGVEGVAAVAGVAIIAAGAIIIAKKRK